MEYKIITLGDSNYPKKFIERLGDKCPKKLYYNGPLEYLNKFTIAVLCSEDSGGVAFMEMNQVLYTLRDYAINYIGGWFSWMEREIFMLGLYRSYSTVVIFSSKGLKNETFDSFLLEIFPPPMHQFPQRKEYFRRAQEGKLLMLSIVEPDEKRKIYKNIMERNFVSCALADIVFIPYAIKGSKTYTSAKRILKANIPVFTVEHNISKDLHDLGIPGYNRKTVKNLLEEKGAKLPVPEKVEVQRENIPEVKIPYEVKQPSQATINFIKEKKRKKYGD